MTDLLTDLWNTGLIDKVDGHDDRLTKIENAAEAVAQEFRDHPPLLIRAILAGLDPDIPADDPALVQAEHALINEWKSMRSVHTDRPVNLLRAILLAACNLASDDGNNAAILWLTAADTLPMLRLGKEETVVRQILNIWASFLEKMALISHSMPNQNAEQAIIEEMDSLEITTFETYEVDRDTLLQKMTNVVGQQNGYSSITHNGFSSRMKDLLADELNTLASDLNDSLSRNNQQIQTYLAKQLAKQNEVAKKVLTVQQKWILETQQSEQIRLNALWWSEALYSSSLTCSYRELPQTIATVVMAIDLLNEVTKPTPASVGYLLAEAVNRLPEAGFERKLTLEDLLTALAKDRAQLPKAWQEALTPPPESGRLSLRDLVVLVLANPTTDITAAIKRTGASGEYEMSLPKFAHALFRQEQAVQLAGSGQ